MYEVKIFENSEFGAIRTVTDRVNSVWFCGSDVAKALGYERGAKAVADHVDSEDKHDVPIRDSIGRMQNTAFINESGLYSLVLSSKLPTAKKFKRWVTSEVLPSIRKNGGYIVGQQINSGAEMRQQLKIRKTGLKDELAIVEKQIMAADNSDKEERIEQLEAEMREIAQNVADEEKMLYLLEQFMKTKMMIISKMVNEKFGIVSWKLFDKQVNGAVVECCECTYKGVGINKDLNNGHRVVAGLDIIRTLSRLHNVYAPIFVDNAEAVNDFNYPGMETQMILLKVSEDDELKVEREEM